MSTEPIETLLTPGGPSDINTTAGNAVTYRTSAFYQHTVPFDTLHDGPSKSPKLPLPCGATEEKFEFFWWCFGTFLIFATGVYVCTEGNLVSIIGGIITILLALIPAKIARNKYGPAFVEGYVAPESLLDPVGKRRRRLKREFWMLFVAMILFYVFGGMYIVVWILGVYFVVGILGIVQIVMSLLCCVPLLKKRYKPAFVDGYLKLNDVIPDHLMGVRQGLYFDVDEQWIKIVKWRMIKRDELQIEGLPIRVCRFDELREIGWEFIEYGDGWRRNEYYDKAYLLLMHANRNGATDDDKVVVIKYKFKEYSNLEAIEKGYDVMKEVIMNADDSWFENQRVFDKGRMYNEQMMNDKRYILEDEVKVVFGK